jgi:formate hydrogenlyase subunit 3/multisubunit Na+/H+ antiporter MnhD subunit
MPLALFALLPSLLLLAAALFISTLGARLQQAQAAWAGALASVLALGSIVALWPRVAAGQRLDLTYTSLLPGLAFGYALDALSLFFACGLLALATVTFTGMALDPTPSRAPVRLHVAALALLLAGLQACFAGNLLLLYGSIEGANLAAFVLFTCGSRRRAERAARWALVIHISGLGLLAAALLILHSSGTAELTAVPAETFGPGIMALMLAAGVVRLAAPAALAWARLPPDRAKGDHGTRGILALALGAGATTLGLYLVARMLALVQAVLPHPGLRVALLTAGMILAAVGLWMALSATASETLVGGVLLGQGGLVLAAWALPVPLALYAGLVGCLQTLWLAATGLLLADRRGGGPVSRVLPGVLILGMAAGLPGSLGFLANLLAVQSALASGGAYRLAAAGILLLAILLAGATLGTGRRLRGTGPGAAGQSMERLMVILSAAALLAATFPQWGLAPLPPTAAAMARSTASALLLGPLEVRAVAGAWPAGLIGLLLLGAGLLAAAGRRTPAWRRVRFRVAQREAGSTPTRLPSLGDWVWPVEWSAWITRWRSLGSWGLAALLMYVVLRR